MFSTLPELEFFFSCGYYFIWSSLSLSFCAQNDQNREGCINNGKPNETNPTNKLQEPFIASNCSFKKYIYSTLDVCCLLRIPHHTHALMRTITHTVETHIADKILAAAACVKAKETFLTVRDLTSIS